MSDNNLDLESTRIVIEQVQSMITNMQEILRNMDLEPDVRKYFDLLVQDINEAKELLSNGETSSISDFLERLRKNKQEMESHLQSFLNQK